MRRINLNDEKALRRWWNQRHSDRTLQWQDLSSKQKVLLTAWFLLADAESPLKTEALPLECGPALEELATTVGKSRRYRFQKLPRGGARPGYHQLANHRRQVRAS